MNRQITVIISLFLVLVLGIGLVSPKYKSLKLLQKKIEEKKVELQSREEYFSNLKQTSKDLQDYEVQISKIDFALPSDTGLPALFDFIQKASSQSGLVLRGVTPSGIKPSQNFEGLQEAELTLIVSGSYTSFKNFLSTLEKTSRLIEVEGVSFSSSEKETPLNFDLRIKVYSY